MSAGLRRMSCFQNSKITIPASLKIHVEDLAIVTAPILNLGQDSATEVVKTMGVISIGVSGTEQGPSLEGETISADVQTLIDSFSPHELFIKNACRIIAGIRIEQSAA